MGGPEDGAAFPGLGLVAADPAVRVMAGEPAHQQEAINTTGVGGCQGMNQVPRGLETIQRLPYSSGDEPVIPPTTTTKHCEKEAPAGGPQ